MIKTEAMKIIDDALKKYADLLEALKYFQRMDYDNATESETDKEYIYKAYRLTDLLDSKNTLL